YLAGKPDNEAFNRALNAAIFSRAALGNGDGAANFVLAADSWIGALTSICHPRAPLTIARRHYICRKLAFDWRANLPDGFAVQIIDEDLLSRPLPDHIPEWIHRNWGSNAAFLDKGFGAVTLHDDRLVSWSLADCVSGSGCEIGIRTDPAYRRRGLAAITTAAAIECALSRGLSEVGWHCHEENVGSFKTAEKVGFELERCYTLYYMFVDEAEHLAESAWIAFQSARYAESVDLFGRVFALRDDMPHYCYHTTARAWAALGDTDKALAYLDETVKRDWSYRDFTESCAEFEPLRTLPQWTTILDRMSSKEA
ncbi:MAG: GNAT family N-acetyltransferase, partial [Chloroflexi bacterium]